MGRRGHGQRGQRGEAHEAAAVEAAGGVRRVEEEQQDAGQRGDADDVEEGAVPAGPAVGQRGRPPEEREQGAHEDRRDPGVGAVVEAARVLPGLVEDGHPHGRRRGHPGHGQRDGTEPAPEPAQQHDEDQRPQQVELLLDGERPQVAQQQRTPELLEVRAVGRDEVPVGRVRQRRQDLRPQLGRLVAEEEHHDDAGRGQQQVERGQEPAGPAPVEAAHADGARTVVLLQEQHGDQVAADHEEDVDAEEATRQPAARPRGRAGRPRPRRARRPSRPGR